MLLGLRRRKKKLPPRPDVSTGEDDFSGAIVTTAWGTRERLSFRQLAERKRQQMGMHDHVGPQERLRYQKLKDPHYTEKK